MAEFPRIQLPKTFEYYSNSPKKCFRNLLVFFKKFPKISEFPRIILQLPIILIGTETDLEFYSACTYQKLSKNYSFLALFWNLQKILNTTETLKKCQRCLQVF